MFVRLKRSRFLHACYDQKHRFLKMLKTERAIHVARAAHKIYLFQVIAEFLSCFFMDNNVACLIIV